ncbi:ABC transporter substrate-binding protein [Pseudonocardia acidicola]|uniref:ABC transporter substrate-binding protein n=1 Tax=Pseudonocardia acidicola TaxID=2724939 RepID=A0ABX1S5S9_9PSEU|nr:ABC transporter substrate-binding protein [Pseudonocardia acidicola]NMH96920.1 ABC transporter substrate-binding protein [Pseudonocardia acidicola]
MAELHLTTVTRTQGANSALKDGSVSPGGAVLDFVEVPVLPHAFRRMVRNLEFDVSEMAVTTYLVAKAHGVRFTALPVFLVRGFHHEAIQVAAGSGVRPEGLAGKRVGVNRGYTVTTGVWARAVLAEEYGVDLDEVVWALSGDEHVREYRAPANTEPAGGDLAELLASGKLAAVIGAGLTGPDVAPLVPEAREAGLRALRKDGFHPVNHLVVVRDELLAAHPGLAEDLFAAFAAAKRGYVEALRAGAITDPTPADRLNAAVAAATGGDPLPYGLEPNRAVLERLLDHALSQHILDARPDLHALFAEGTHNLIA